MTNETNGDKKPSVVPASGEFSAEVRLRRGNNHIVVTSKDAAGQRRDDSIKVKRLDGRPTVKVKAPARVKKSSLPEEIRVVVQVTDVDGKKMDEAEVYYALGGSGRNAIIESDVTDADGRSSWEPTIERSTSWTDSVELSVRVTSPTGDPRTVSRVIALE